MITTSDAWKEYAQNNSIFHIKGTLTDTKNNTISLTDEDFMMGSVQITDSTSSTSSFDIGSVITNTFHCTLNNTEGKFDQFNFNGAKLNVALGGIESTDTNIFDGMLRPGGIRSSDGSISKSSQLLCSDYISVTPGATYDFSIGGSNLYVFEYDENYSYISPYQVVWQNRPQPQQITLSANTHYIAVQTEITYGMTYKGDIEIVGEGEEWIRRGAYIIDRPASMGFTIQIDAYDYMDTTNRPYIGRGTNNEEIVFPIDSESLVKSICDYCGVGYTSSMWQVSPNITIDEFEYNESTTCREVIGWIAQVNCAFARMSPSGMMEISWYSSGSYIEGDDYDFGTVSPWSDADTFDGGYITPWTETEDINGGYYLDYAFTQVSTVTVDSEDTMITGVRVYVPNTVSEFDFATVGYSGYILAIENNPIITSQNKEGIANTIYSVIGGMTFRQYTASVYGDPSYEAGDLIEVSNYLGNKYFSYITNLTYTLNGLVDAECGAETPSNQENSYSNSSTSVLAGAAVTAYDYIQTKKLSADYIDAGTIEATVIAKDFKLEGGSINIETNDENADWIKLNLNTGTGRFTSDTKPTLMGISCDYDYYADFIGNRNVNAGLEVGRWDGQTQIPVLTADALGNVYINGTGTATFSGAVTASSFVNSSRIDLKENLKKVDSILDKIKGADILSFNFVEDAKKHIGLAIGGEYNVPEEVIAKDDNGEEQGVDLYSMVSMAWKAIQEQQTIIEGLEKRIEVLEKKLNPIGNIKDIIKGDTDGTAN